MKRKFRSIAVIAVSILTAAAFTFPSDVLAASKGNPSPTATNVEYVMKGGKKFKKIKTLKGNTLNVKKAAGRKLKNGRYYKFIVLAISSKDRLVTASKVIHAGTKAKKSGKPTKLTVKAKVNKYGNALKKYKATESIALKAGKTTRLKTVQKKLRGYKVKKHAKIRYQSSDVNIATVNSYGKIKARKKGSCKVFVYTQNGICKTVKVKVR